MTSHFRKLVGLAAGRDHTCPRWLCFTFDNPLRRRFHDAAAILGPHVSPGDRVLDMGPGTGYFTIPLARLVGPDGTVVAADIQKAMLDAIERRAARAGVGNVRTLLVDDRGLDPAGRFDFALLFWMLHEVADRDALLRSVRDRLNEGGRVLVVEPKGHVRAALFDREMQAARAAGFEVVDRPRVAFSRAALLQVSGAGR